MRGHDGTSKIGVEPQKVGKLSQDGVYGVLAGLPQALSGAHAGQQSPDCVLDKMK